MFYMNPKKKRSMENVYVSGREVMFEAKNVTVIYDYETIRHSNSNMFS